MIRVLHLIKGLGPGGAEQLLVNQATASDGSVEYSAAYLVSYKHQLVPALERLGVDVVCLGSDRPWDLRWLLRLRRLLAAGDVTVVHSHSPLVAAFARVVLATVPRRRRPRSLYTEHNEWGRHRIATRLLNRVTIGLEDRVLAVSAGVRRSMPARLDVEVLEHGVDVVAVRAAAARDDVRRELDLAPDTIVVGIVANMRAEKAYPVLLDAAAIVVDGGDDVAFVSVGQGPLEADVRARRDALRLGDRFRLLGYRPDAVRVLSACDVFVLSSRHEGLPVALMEAMALGLPVVATSVGGVPEATEGGPAILVEPDDPAALAAALGAGIERWGSRADRGPVEWNADRFDIGHAAARLEALYAELAAA